MKYGIQLYSMRDLAVADFDACVKKAGELGYDMVEFAGFFGRTADQVNALLKEAGVEVFGTHSGAQELINDFEGTVKFHKAIGNTRFIIPGFPLGNKQEIDTFVDILNKYQPMLEKEGILLGYHNHSSEFLPTADGYIPEYELAARTNVLFEIDTYWAYNAGQDPVAVMEMYKDRLISIHIKDGFEGGRGMPLGKGSAPVSAVYAKAVELGVPMVVESETCNPSGAAEAEICIGYLKSLEK